jgi:sugar phosphate permease
MNNKNDLGGIVVKKINIAWLKAPLLPISPNHWKPWLVCFSANLFCFYQIMQSNMLNSLNAALLKAFSIDATTIGHISTSYFYSNVLFLFIAGFLIDYIPRRVILIAACAVNALAIFCFSLAQAPWQVFICHFITGFSETFSLTACIRLATRWFPRKNLAAIIGLMGGFANFGGIIAQSPFTASINHFGWRTTLLFDAALGIVILLIIFAFVQDQPRPQPKDGKIASLTLTNLKSTFKEVATNGKNWLTGIYAGLTVLPIFLLGALWGNLYLTQAHQLSPQQAALISSMLFVGQMLGSPLLGWLSDHFSNRKLPMQISVAAGFALSIGLLLNTSSSQLLLYVLFFWLGFITGAQSVAYSFVTENNKKAIISSAQGFVATVMMAMGILQILFATLVERGWDGQYKNDAPLYAMVDFHRALIILPVTFVIAFLITLKIKEKNRSKHG